ncbi:ACP phosphodiesterase [Niveibacterium sp. 24ML]|uniref:acyl carrier protein phosphodiesterase n=1 Tax=Niveibacterium sp. 24ML TaxID=2985512 RepID=UPI00226F805F|nr:ACP phosphodiesterase [Niveibacterium sp. 24ML]MCX9155732.1 ACP phosphodiesterase [Niveibacterium sp. 24ML]
MNYLAHALLAGPAITDRVGGLAGDFVKGLLPGTLPPGLAAGVALHRAIDQWADSHPAFRASRARVSPARRRYAGILVDVFYDHLLAVHWDHYHAMPLARFTRQLYEEAALHVGELPSRFAQVLPLMQSDDWLAAYREPAAVGFVLDGMSRRHVRQPNPLAGALAELERNYAGFEADFLSFMPAAIDFAERRLITRVTCGQ